MKVFVHYPETEEDKQEFEARLAKFHATLMVQKIKNLHISDKSKKEVFNSVLEYLDKA